MDLITSPDRRFNCWLCHKAVKAPGKWAPDNSHAKKGIEIRKDHCSLLCYRRWKLLKGASRALRLEDAIASLDSKIEAATDSKYIRQLENRRAIYLAGWVMQKAAEDKKIAALTNK